MQDRSAPSGLKDHLRSARMALLYSFFVHVTVWLAVSVVFLSAPASGMAYMVVPALLVIVGLIVFTVLKSRPTEKLTFYASLLIFHILLSMLALAVDEPLMRLLRSLRGTAAVGPEATLDGLYFLYAWVVLAVGMGVLLFVLAVAFLVRDALRETMGYRPREKKSKSKGPKQP